MTRIYHFITKSDLDQHLDAKVFRVPSLAGQGFIHCSKIDQVLDVANYIAPYSEEMLLLEIDEAKVLPEIRYENLEGGERLFPHIYGPLNRDAILAIHPLDWDGEDGYQLPEVLRNDLA
ncbi:MAG: DUF952 domain-containing protein [Bacteroidota bacterium]|nr:DUF952 domain-containing protein [Bacteroidota bacterium]MDP4232535.1 DUF952 domain-containing protein [Bacteroidota bacterium]MDP4241670.1 DUF952 domain-containing protein [Bacteroidota bacterium]